MSASLQKVSQPPPHARAIGRYVLYDQIGSGGMATVHFGRLRGPAGFARTVAIKRLHPHLASNPQFASVFVSEARLAARVRHPNVVSLLDVIGLESGELLLVMEYVHGETLAALLGAARVGAAAVPPALASAIMVGVLRGLHAAHEAVNEGGLALGLVHGDVSPRNIIVDTDGAARVLDFGVAKIGSGAARGLSRLGTPGYMSPEKLEGDRFDRRADVFSAGAVLWEMLCLRRLYPRAERGPASERPPVGAPSTFNPEVSPALDAVVLRALRASQEERFPTARAFAVELERACPPAPSHVVSAWVTSMRGPALERRARELARIETVSVAELLDAGVDTAHSRARLPEPPTAARAVPEPLILEPTMIEPPREEEKPTAFIEPSGEEEKPTVVESVTPHAPRSEPPAPVEEAQTVCEPRVSGRVIVRSPTTVAPAVDEPPPPPSRARPARRVPPAARSVLPAVAILGAMYSAAALDGKQTPTPIRASAAAPVASPEVRPDGPALCVAPTASPEARAPDVLVMPTPPPPPRVERSVRVPSATALAPARAATTIVGLNRRAIAAYEQLEASRALQLLTEGLRLCERAGLGRGDLAALTHLNMGIVLAGGFKQRGLAVQQFRRARSIRPGIQPSGSLLSPDISAAFAEAK
jgi:serine/threonine-protein kinase